jgi:hypothetical protein
VCQEVRVLFNLVARDMQFTTAENLKFVEKSPGVDPWTAGPGKHREAIEKNQLVNIPPQDAWKLSYIGSLLMQLQQAKHLAQEDRDKYTQDLIDSLVI